MIQTDLYSFSYKKGTLVPWCKRCSGIKLHRSGKNNKGKQLYECDLCSFRFVWTSDLPRRNFFSNIICFAIDLYSTVGISLRTISEKLLRFFSIKVSYEGIRKWIAAKDNLGYEDKLQNNSKIWHVDETYIRIKGKGFWLWIVFCANTKQVLAWHISKKRLYKDARTVLRSAMQRTNNVKPEKIITDGLYQYQAAIKKEVGWRWNIQKERHVIDSDIGKNAILERVNREVKRRFRWFGTFQSLKGAEAFFGMFFYHYNRRRSTQES